METHDEIKALLGAYALDAVDEAERAAVEAHLSGCPRCAAEVADHREVAAMLAHTGGDAPEGVWAEIAASLDEPPPAFRMPGAADAPADAADELARRRARWLSGRRVLAAAAAAAVLIVGVVVGSLISADGSGGGGSGQAAASLEAVAREAINDPDATTVTLESLGEDSLTATAAVEPDGSGYLIGTSLPALDAAQTYQLWGVREGTVVSLGVLGHEPDIVAFHADPGTEALAITREVAGGVPVSENEALLVGNLG